MKLEKEVYIGNVNEKTYESGKYNICFHCVFNKSLNTTDKLIFDKIVKSKNIKLTLEVEEPILDDAERKYLSGFIKPFRDEIEYIRKVPNEYYKAEHLVIYFKDNMNMPFPYFKKGSMYKGMKVDKNYTLKGLGL